MLTFIFYYYYLTLIIPIHHQLFLITINKDFVSFGRSSSQRERRKTATLFPFPSPPQFPYIDGIVRFGSVSSKYNTVHFKNPKNDNLEIKIIGSKFIFSPLHFKKNGIKHKCTKN